MANALSIDLARALRAARDAATACFRTLRAPYETALASAPDVPPAPTPDVAPGMPRIQYPTYEQATGLEPLPAERPVTRSEVLARPLGPPRLMSWTKTDDPLKSLAGRVSRLGGVAHPIHAVIARQGEVGSLLEAYGRGDFAGVPIEDWLAQLGALEAGVVKDVDRAIAMCASYATLAAQPKRRRPRLPAILTTADAAAHLGIEEPAVAKRIRRGTLGPWKKSGAAWHISREAFRAWFDGQPVGGAAPAAAARRRSKTSAVDAVMGGAGRGRRGARGAKEEAAKAVEAIVPPPKKRGRTRQGS